MRARVYRDQECGNCYGIGCLSCGGHGMVESAEARERREDWEDGAYDRAQDERITDG
jgi:hypothetical protein